MTWSRVGVLADDEDAHVVERRGEGSQDRVAGGQPLSTGRSFSPEEVADRGEVVALRIEHRHPGGVDEILECLGHAATLAAPRCFHRVCR